MNGSPSMEIVSPARIMKDVSFSKEKYMSSRNVRDILSIAPGASLIEKGEVTKGAALADTGRHMSIKNFNLKFGDLEDYESRRDKAIDEYYRG